MSAVLLSLAVSLVLPGCFPTQGACVHGSSIYFCNEDTEDECRDFWCDGWDYCGYFDGDSCEDVGFSDGEVLLNSFSEPRTPDWLSLIHISEPTRHAQISYAVFCLKKKTKTSKA
ncbi:hypothetical protein D7Y27_40425, partial [Corallococcus sp. AB004]